MWATDINVAGMATGVILSACIAPMMAADRNRIGAMQGLGSAVKSQVPDLLVRPVATAVIVSAILVIAGGVSATSGAIAYSAATLFGLLVGTFMLRSSLKVALTGEPANETVSWREFIPLVATMSVLGGSKVLTGNVDLILFNVFGDLEGAGHYKVALAGLAVVAMGLTSIQTVVYTRLAESVSAQDHKATMGHIDKTVGWQVFLTSAVLTAVLTVGRPVIELLYGKDYVDAWPTLVILSLGFLVASACGPAEEILMLSGRQLLAATIILASVAVSIVLAIIIYPTLGANGIAIASATANALRSIALMLITFQTIGANTSIVGTVRRRATRRRNSTKVAVKTKDGNDS